MRHPRIGRGRVEAGLVGGAGGMACHRVVDLQDHPFGAILAVRGSSLRLTMGKVSMM